MHFQVKFQVIRAETDPINTGLDELPRVDYRHASCRILLDLNIPHLAHAGTTLLYIVFSMASYGADQITFPLLSLMEAIPTRPVLMPRARRVLPSFP